jgi:hypothetical protein
MQSRLACDGRKPVHAVGGETPRRRERVRYNWQNLRDFHIPASPARVSYFSGPGRINAFFLRFLQDSYAS